MSVLINMEMPTRCGDCPIGDTLCCSLMPGVPALWKEYTLALRTNRRHKDCPLVPVPPHGRLIDGDLAEGIYFTEEDENGKDFCDGILYAADWISKQPTIIPADRRERDV